MANWEINPNDGVTLSTRSDGSVKIHFEPNRSATVYTIMYTDDDGCAAMATYRLKVGCGAQPPEDDLPTGPGGSTDVAATMDNMGRVCKSSKTADPCLACFACGSNNWWSGPLDGDGDRGEYASGGTLYDSIRYDEIGAGSSSFASSYTSAKFNVTSNDTWIKVKVTNNPHLHPDGVSLFSGEIEYLIDENTSNYAREGTVTVTTAGGTCGYNFGDSLMGKQWMTSGKVYIYQRGKDTCECSTTPGGGGGGTGGGPSGPSEPTEPTEPTTCSPTNNSALNTYLNNFKINSMSITTTTLPCTYYYIQQAYNHASSTNSFTNSFLIANVLSELTPYKTTCEGYFKAAANAYGTLNLNIEANTSTYNSRTEGGLKYAKFKHDKYADSQTWAEKAREELRSKGVTEAVLRDRLHPEQSNPVWFSRTEGIDITCVCPSSAPSNNGADVTYLQNLIDTYPSVDSLATANDYQALVDKKLCEEYICSIMGLDVSKYKDFIYLTKDVADAGANLVKESTPRWRPGAQQKLTSIFDVSGGKTVYLCDYDKEYGRHPTCKDSTIVESTYCTNDTNSFTDTTSGSNGQKSFPSGHSSRVYMMLLNATEATGGSTAMTNRIVQYCDNRNVVRAHWHSDVTAGKLCASMQIGYLNGFKEYHNLLKAL